MTVKTVKNAIKVLNYGKPFFADELEMNGGEINALMRCDFIKETGKTKKYFVELDDDYAKKVTVSEWVAVPQMIAKAKNEIEKQIDELSQLLAVFG